VLQVENRFSTKNDPILEKDLKISAAVQKILCGIELSEMDFLNLPSEKLLGFFKIKVPDSVKDLMKDDLDKSESSKSIFDEDWDFTGSDDFNVDEFLTRIKVSGEAEDEEDIDDEDGTGIPTDEDPADSNDLNRADTSGVPESDSSKPYTSDIDYLYQEYLWLKAQATYSEKVTDKYVINENEHKEEIKELKQTIQKQKNICELRLNKTRKTKFLPRLVRLSDDLNLTQAELGVIKLLTIGQIFSIEKNFSHSSTTVGEILGVLFDDIRDMIKAKQMFMKDARLIKSNIIKLERRSLDSNFFNVDISIDTRLIEYLGGEDYDISNYVEGSFLFNPNVKMEDVIIPESEKRELLTKIENFPSYLKTKKKIDVGTHVQYGDAFVMVHTGPSGSGKTMLALAVANYLKKRILTVNLHNHSHFNHFGSDGKSLFGLLFREAKMNDAILFFDEAEMLLSERLNDLLIDIEKHTGIVIFATNASFTIDEAMRRRINHIQKFDEPGPQLRKLIWKNHLPTNINIDDDVDLNYLALRYEINGGLIKNAVFSAISWAVAESKGDNIVLKMKHLDKGASEQLHNKLFMSKLETDKVPVRGIDDAVYPENIIKSLRTIASLEKARKVLEGEWGFKDVFPDHRGAAGLFFGPSGTGKSLAAEIIAYETGRTLKVVNYAQLVSKYVGDTEKNIETLFTKVKNDNSILLFDEADAIFTGRSAVNSATDRYANMETNVLLSMIEEADVFAILTTNLIDNIDPAFLRRFRFTVEFELPDASLRELLWKKLVPEKLPLADDVDFKSLAKRFTFTGGDIRNAIIRAASQRAVNLEGNREVTQQDFIDACEQMVTIKQNKQKEIGF
jgi:SpoVK/Ycf46/Vps4 family AAA+-type ATPase